MAGVGRADHLLEVQCVVFAGGADLDFAYQLIAGIDHLTTARYVAMDRQLTLAQPSTYARTRFPFTTKPTKPKPTSSMA